MRRYIYTALVLLFSLTSCDNLLSGYDSKWVPIDDNDFSPSLCVFANYIHEKGLGIEISSTKSIDLKTKGPEILKAKILMMKSNLLMLNEQIDFQTDHGSGETKSAFLGIEKFNDKPDVGDTLTISIEVNGYEPVSGKTIIPEKAIANTLTAAKFISEDTKYRFMLQFTDKESYQNFYLVSSIYYLTTTSLGDHPYSYKTSDRELVPLFDPVFDFMPNVRSSSKEPFDISLFKPRIFSDKGFDGHSYELKIEVPVKKNLIAEDFTRYKYESVYEVELYSISKDLFEGYKSGYMQRVIDGDIYAEPIMRYSNMNNKIGLFGAINGPSSQNATIETNDILQFDPNGL